MFEVTYAYTKEEAMAVGDHHLGLMTQIDKMRRGRMMKVKSLSEVSKRWMFIAMAMVGVSVISLLEFFSEREAYLLVFAAVVFAYGISCIFTGLKEKKRVEAYVPVLEGTVTFDGKGMRESRDGQVVKEFTWKEFEFCIVTEAIMCFFGKDKGTICFAYTEENLEKFQKFLEEQKMDEDYVIQC